MAIVKKVKAVVNRVIRRGDDVFTLELSLQGRTAKFLPGQFLHLALDEYDPSYGWPESRCFSLQSSPKDSIVRLTYAVKGAYTQRMLEEIKPGTQLWLKLPYGDLFTRPHCKNKTIFIAGGTGVTPFLSLFGDEAFVAYNNPALYLGLRNEGHDFYGDELLQAQLINSALKIHRFIQEIDGLIDLNMVLGSASSESHFFISGPMKMIRWCRDSLRQRGVQEERIFTDDWV
ncbi:MAG: FAD-dependent oxidoreductase [Spirochaetales bacterium]|jgi:ferredoxin-NADP reductase|nr:FAD-dependent oxidoreductase [Spirochaetales bacterium]